MFARRHTDPRRCPDCRRFAFPVSVDASEVADEVVVLLRCGECGTSRAVQVSLVTCERILLEHERECQTMARIAERQDLARLEEEADAFARALRDDRIVASDFEVDG